jgi:hypothetical protein
MNAWKPGAIEGTWIAQPGDGAESLAKDAGISRAEAYRVMDEQGHGTYVDRADGVTKSKVDPGDIVKVSEPSTPTSPKLFEPLPLNKDIYQNILRGLKYIYHYDAGTLADYEMERWGEGRELMMSDVWDFSTATPDVGWQTAGYLAGDGIIYGEFEGGKLRVMLQNTPNTGHLQVDPRNFGRIRVIQTENNGKAEDQKPDRTIGRLIYRSDYQLKRARNYIYGTH